MSDITLTEEQMAAHDSVVDWVKSFYSSGSGKGWITLAGLAGTGKTTIVKFIAETIKSDPMSPHSIAYVTYTGKASFVLRSKLGEVGDEDFIGTIHSLIYKPIVDEDGNVKGWARKTMIDQSLIIVDEGSMVNKDLWNDLLGYGLPIIVVGDHGQLPPIGETNFSLMKKPDVVLKKIHRQALENPIIKVSLYARKYGEIPEKVFGPQMAKLNWVNSATQSIIEKYKIGDDTQILCGMNATRVKINDMIRENNGLTRPEPYAGEKLICLRNNKKDHVMNGQMGTLVSNTIHSDDLFNMEINMDGDDYNRTFYCYKAMFGRVKYDTAMNDMNQENVRYQAPYGKKINAFDFGYAISVHKAQGSEWPKVILFEERNYYQSDEDYARWLYTGLTRARDKMLVIKNFY